MDSTYAGKFLPIVLVVALIRIPEKILQSPEFTVQIVVNFEVIRFGLNTFYRIVILILLVFSQILQIELGYNIQSRSFGEREHGGQK